MPLRAYYEDEFATIFCGDCREILPHIQRADLILSDPPYGIRSVRGGRTFGKGNLCPTNDYMPVSGDDGPFDPGLLLSRGTPAILWGANHYASRLPDASRWLVWDKRVEYRSNPLADCELAWTSLGGPARMFRFV